MLKQILKSKTMLFALLLAVLGVIQTSMEVFTPYISAQSAGVLTLIISLAVAVLRVLTTTSLGEK
jgi:protein-S-isoprenylcysteine O-methyltransferase Ste14